MSQLLTVSSVDSFILPTIYFMNYRLLYNIYIYYIVNVKYIYFSTLKPAPKKLSTEETEEFAVRVATTSLAFNRYLIMIFLVAWPWRRI